MDVSRHSKNQTTLPPQARYITSHDAMGKSIFDSTVPEQAAFEAFSSDMDYFLAYMTTKAPEDLTSNQDLRRYRTQLEGSHPPITIPGGLILRVCNFAPGSVTAMHRTISIDFGIVVAGEVELVLDSGETRLLKGRYLRERDVALSSTNVWPFADSVRKQLETSQFREPRTIAGECQAKPNGLGWFTSFRKPIHWK